MRQSYPEQQVMIMDISTIACLASERMVSDKALLAFQTITRNEPLTKSTLCSQYYPASWASVAIYGAKDGESSAVRTLQIGETLSYSKFREAWFNLISSEPSSFVQAKLLLGSQLLLAGESPKIRIKNIRQSLQLPFEILKAIRLFSIIPSLILIFAFGVFLRRKNVIDYQIILGVLGFYLIAITLVIVAFIGDNQRYILPFTLISLLLLILGQENSSRKQVNHG
jgi:hypothetical protein